MNTRPLALVTGAGKRLGLAITETLIAAGWDVLALVRSHTPALNALHRTGAVREIILMDLADPALWSSLWPTLQSRFGGLPTGFVHAASLFELDTPQTTDWSAIEAHRRVNADAFMAAATAWVQSAPPDARGSFVSLVDQKVHRLNPDHYAYTLSKLTLAASIPFLAQSLAPQLRVNGVSPGLTLPSGGQTPAEFAAAQALFPLGAGLAPADIARTVLFLLTQPWITGQIVAVDGGQHLQSDHDIVLR
jgi:NAD(P)-dependent dehydrogenase (short-subunit alcohol dehydrogenase family)